METHLIPVKTAQGHEELSSRQRRVGQRHRTMLLLVDGQRTVDALMHLSRQAGVPESCLGELISWGLVVVPQSTGMHWVPRAANGAESAMSEDAAEAALGAAALQVDRNRDVDAEVDVLLGKVDDNEDDRADTPPTTSLPDTEFGMSTVVTDSVLDESDSGALLHNPLEEARELLVHAVTTEAPVAGALTLMRLKRARTPMDLLALINEVETRISRPHRAMATQQLMGRVAQLLSQAESLHATSDVY